MDAIKCIETRSSVRRFKPDSVPQRLLEQVLEAARWAPSYKNTQPWEVVVVSGEKKDGLSRLLTGLLEEDAPSQPDIPHPTSWPEAIERRMNEHLLKRLSAMGVDLNDPAMRKRSKLANFRFYGAPHAMFLYQDAGLTPWSIFDLGLFAQSLMLAAHALGLGTVPQAFLTDYAPQVKEYLGIPANKRLVLGISIGYPDIRENDFRSTRMPVSEFTTWLE